MWQDLHVASDRATVSLSDDSDENEVGLNYDVETEDTVGPSSADSLVTDAGPAPPANAASGSAAEGGPLAT